MVAFREGNNHPAGTPVANVKRFTPGKYVSLNRPGLRGTGVKMCDTKGEKAQFIFNDTVDAVANGMGVGLMTPLTGADAARALAWGPVADGEDVIVHISVADGLPKFASADTEGAPGDFKVGRAVFGNFSTAEDVADADGFYHPSLTIFLYSEPVEIIAEVVT